MIRLSGRTQLTCVQGDTFAIRIRVRLGLDKIKSLEFICSELGIEKPFIDDNRTIVNGKWIKVIYSKWMVKQLLVCLLALQIILFA